MQGLGTVEASLATNTEVKNLFSLKQRAPKPFAGQGKVRYPGGRVTLSVQKCQVWTEGVFLTHMPNNYLDIAKVNLNTVLSPSAGLLVSKHPALLRRTALLALDLPAQRCITDLLVRAEKLLFSAAK